MSGRPGWTWADVYPGRRIVTLVLTAGEADELLDQAAAEGRMIGPNVILGMPSIAFGDCEEAEPDQLHQPSCDISAKHPAADDVHANASEDGATPAEPFEPLSNIVILPCVRREPMPETVEPSQEEIEPCDMPSSSAPTPSRSMRATTRGLPESRAAQTPTIPTIRPKTKTISTGTRAGSSATATRTTALELSPARRSFLDERPPVEDEIAPARMPRWNPVTRKPVKPGEVTAADRKMVADAIAAGFPITKCPPRKHSVEIGQPDAGSPYLDQDRMKRGKAARIAFKRSLKGALTAGRMAAADDFATAETGGVAGDVAGDAADRFTEGDRGEDGRPLEHAG